MHQSTYIWSRSSGASASFAAAMRGACYMCPVLFRALGTSTARIKTAKSGQVKKPRFLVAPNPP